MYIDTDIIIKFVCKSAGTDSHPFHGTICKLTNTNQLYGYLCRLTRRCSRNSQQTFGSRLSVRWEGLGVWQAAHPLAGHEKDDGVATSRAAPIGQLHLMNHPTTPARVREGWTAHLTTPARNKEGRTVHLAALARNVEGKMIPVGRGQNYSCPFHR